MDFLHHEAAVYRPAHYRAHYFVFCRLLILFGI